MSMARLAEATAAVPWLATLFELAATSIRLVTAISPKISTTTATRASTRVNPASAPRGTSSRLVSVMLCTSRGGRRERVDREHAAAGGDAHDALEAGRDLAQADLHRSGGRLRPDVGAVQGRDEQGALRRRRPLAHRNRGRAGVRGIAEPAQAPEAKGGTGEREARLDEDDARGELLQAAQSLGARCLDVLLDESEGLAV